MFQDWAQRGFREELIPIKPGTKVPAIKNWPEHIVTQQNIDNWEITGYNIGLRTKYYPAIDIDSENPEVIERIVHLANKYLGAAPIRYRNNTNRCALLYATDTPFSEVKFNIGNEKVEIKASGRQIAVYGIHPDSSEYYWDKTFNKSDLTKIVVGQVNKFVSECTGVEIEEKEIRINIPTKHKLDLWTNNIITAKNYNDSLTALASHCASRAYPKYFTEQILLGLISNSPPNERKAARAKHVPIYVNTAYSKYDSSFKPRKRDDVNKAVQTIPELTLPPGNTGAITSNALEFMKYPNLSIGIATALHTISVFAGRHYRLYNRGFTSKRLVLAPQATGKNTTNKFIQAIAKNLEYPYDNKMPRVINATGNYLGSGDFTSIKGIHNMLSEFACRSLIVPEAGHAGTSRVGDKEAVEGYILQLLSANANEIIMPRNYSLKANEHKLNFISSLSAIFLHESIPDNYAKLLKDEGMFVSGRMARTDLFYTVVDYHNKNRNFTAAYIKPEIMELFSIMVQYSEALPHSMEGSIPLTANQFINAEFDESLKSEIEDWDDEIDNLRANAENDIEAALYARKLERFYIQCLILAVADTDPHKDVIPIVTREHIEWVKQFQMIQEQTIKVMAITGDFADPLDAVIMEVDRVIQKAFDTSPATYNRAIEINKHARQERLIPHKYVSDMLSHSKRLENYAVKYHMDKSRALYTVLREMEQLGYIMLLTPEVKADLNIRSPGKWYRYMYYTQIEELSGTTSIYKYAKE